MPLDSPFPYYGNKRTVADYVWKRLGNPNMFIEPFFGSGAVLRARPLVGAHEIANDSNGFVCNFWRSVKYHPKETAAAADLVIHETEIHSIQSDLVKRTARLVTLLEESPDNCDPIVAGRWAHGLCAWIGTSTFAATDTTPSRSRPGLTDTRGLNRAVDVEGWLTKLAHRFRRVRFACGDWSRVCSSDSVTTRFGTVGVFLDPPYFHETADGKKRNATLYGKHDCGAVAQDVQDWCRANGSRQGFRIALCGYEGEHESLGWECWRWKGAQANANSRRERIWFSPHCVQDSQGSLF